MPDFELLPLFAGADEPPEEAKKTLTKGRKVKYAREIRAVADRALEHMEAVKPVATH
jgi:hypothetical protein